LAKQSLSPAPWDDYWYNPVGTQTTSGMRVDEQVAMNYSVCWAALACWLEPPAGCRSISTSGCPGGGANIAPTHRVHRLIHDQPNGDMGAMMFRSRGVNHQVNWGNYLRGNRAHLRRIPVDR
jgi:phage portal protein BeeE